MESLDAVAQIAAAMLDWDEETTAREKASYQARCDAEREAEGIWDEKQAQAVREQVEPIRPFKDVAPDVQG